MLYEVLMGYLIGGIWFMCLVYLFNGISTPYGLFNTEIISISKCLITIIIIYVFNISLHFLKNYAKFLKWLFFLKNCLTSFFFSELYSIQYSYPARGFKLAIKKIIRNKKL